MPDGKSGRSLASLLTSGKLWLLALGFLALGVTGLFWVRELHEEERKARALFLRQTSLIADGVEEQINLYTQLMRSADGMQRHAPKLLREEWRRFVEALDLDENFPGVSGIGLVKRVREADKAAFETEAARQWPGFEIFPERTMPEHYVNYLLEPERVYRAVGFDVASREDRKEAADRARDSGQVAITSRTTLITPGASGSDLLMYLPIYEGASKPATVEERRKALWGWVALGVSIPKVMRSIHDRMGGVADLSIYDGLEKRQETLLFSASKPGQIKSREHYRAELQRLIGGRVWLIDFTSHADFEDSVRSGRAVIVLAAGLVATFLMALFSWLLLEAKARAERAARLREEELVKERDYAEALLSASPSAILILNGDGVIERSNQAGTSLVGKPAGSLNAQSFLDLFVPSSERSGFAWALSCLKSGGDPMRLELPLARFDEIRVIAWTFSTVRERSSSLRRYVAAGSDVTEHRRAEDTLKAEKMLFVSGPVVFFRWRAESGWPVEYVSPNVSQFGCSAGALTSGELPFMDLIHPDDLGRIASEVARHTSQGNDSFEQKYRLVRPSDGEARWVDDRTLIERDKDGRAVAYLGYVIDVTERVRAEEARQASEGRIARVLEMSSEGYWELDADWRTVAVNPALLKLLEISEAGILGRTPQEFMAPGWESKMAAVMEERKGQAHRRFEMAYLSSSGRVVHARVNATSLFDAKGRLTGSYGLLTDITQEKIAEEALKSEEGRLRLIVDSVPFALVISRIDDAVLVSANQAAHAMFGFPKGVEMKGQPSEGFFKDIADRGRFMEILRGQGVVADFEVRMVRLDKSVFWAMLSGRLVTVDGEECVLIGCMDISARKEAEEKLNRLAEELGRSNAELEQFAYVASHDLQEPLRMIASYVQLLERRYADKLDQDAREYIGFSVDGAKRMQTLITDLLEFSRVTRKGNPFDRVSLDGVCRDALANLAVAAKEAEAKIDVDPLPEVAGDSVQLTRLMQNLIGNAIKYRHAERACEIAVRASRKGRVWEIRVDDNGIGIDKAYFDRIFVIFQRLHTRADYPGTGIGLALCKKIVERHGGRLWVESEPGAGASFIFTIPVLPA
jgi:PAS domain S-box-containing protein